jgi:5'-nucleotidase
MRILLTNDDGIYAPGLRALHAELSKLGEVLVVAPATEQSAAGHSVTIYSPLLVQEVRDPAKNFQGWAVEGRPADCVKLAIRQILPWKPDLVVSGINAGSNAGINVLYSGTVGAAIEGAFFNMPSIACSLEMPASGPPDFPGGASFATKIIKEILAKNPGPGELFNVNIPDLSRGQIKGVRVVPQNTASYVEWFDKRVDPRGRVYYWIGPDFTCPDPHPDTDVTALAEQWITVTPLQFNLTRFEALQIMQEWNWNLNDDRFTKELPI